MNISLVSALLLFGTLVSCYGEMDPGNPLASRLEGKKCDLWDDPTGVTHARGEDELTALACMGLVHARDRAFEMDFLRRTAEGRAAELLGKDAIAGDFQMRLMGLSEEARRIFADMTPTQRQPFWAYAYGVNRGMMTPQAMGAYEFRKFGYEPETWSPVNTLEILLLESLDQTRQSFERKLSEASWLEDYGKDATRLFARGGLPWETTILKPGEYPVKPAAEAALPADHPFQYPAQDLAVLKSMTRLFRSPVGLGSNNWVLAPQRSKTGHAWLANDPHLELTYPPFWYWINVTGGPLDVIGASLPGVPLVPSGANRHVAWGLTNSYMDVADLHYVPDADLKDATTHRPLIWFKYGGVRLPFFFRRFQRTGQGWPVLPLDITPKGKALVLRWSGFDLGPDDFKGLFEIMTASSIRDADRALSGAGVPTWNFVFADDQGGIGFRTNGRLPKHAETSLFGIPESRLSEVTPWAYLTPDEAPHVLRPARGYIVTANNRHWPSGSLFWEGRAYTSSYRAFRIEELIQGSPRQDLESIRRMQCDLQAVDARFLLPPMLRVLKETADRDGAFQPRERAVYDLLSKWDLEADLGCRACGVYDRWMELVLGDQNLNGEALYRLLTRSQPSPALVDSIVKNYTIALDDLKVGADGEVRSWEELHRSFFPSVSGDPSFTRSSIGTPGAENSVNPGTAPFDEARGLFSQTEGASQRLVVEMTSPPTVYSILPGPDADLPDPPIGAADGPWMRWERCELERRAFPVDWGSVSDRAQVGL